MSNLSKQYSTLAKPKNADVNPVTAFFVILVIGLLLLAFQSWILMLLLGALSTFVPWIPALGYGQTVLVVLTINVLGGIIKSILK